LKEVERMASMDNTIRVIEGWKDLDDIINMLEEYSENANSNIESLEEELAKANEKIDELESENEELRGKIEELEDKVNA
jgi:peptidoglycan hydrolase CwlO-like protein